MSTLKFQKSENTGVIYAAPSDLGLSVRFKQTQQPKTLNKIPVENHVTEIIYNDDNSVTLGAIDAVDAISLRVRISGTAHSRERLAALADSLCADLPNWIRNEYVAGGYRPTTPPTTPV